MTEAVALCRVSTLRQQQDGNSLEAQEKYIYECAEKLETTIVQVWSLNASSRKGKNIARKDLKEILEFCKHHKRVRYFILDEPDRFMRSVKEYYWWQVEFERIGVRLAYAKMPELVDQDDPITVMREMFEVFKGEASNHERITKTNDKMRARIAAGYYPFYPHQGYKKTEARDGLHVPDEPRFSLLQSALKAIASFEMTTSEALKWLYLQGYRTPKGNRRLDMNHFVNNILLKPYYAGVLEVKDWPVNLKGLHRPMITVEAHERIVGIVTGRKVRQKKKYNSDFPFNLSFHQECENDDAKLCGINHTNGKGWYRKEYVCRRCKKRIPQASVHQSISALFEQMKISSEAMDHFLKALHDAWHKQEKMRIDEADDLRAQIDKLKSQKNELVRTMATNPDIADDIKEAVVQIKDDISELETKLGNTSDPEADFKEFLAYSLGYVERLKDDFWVLPGEKQLECKQLLFNNEIFVRKDGSVYTPNISPIYTVIKEKDDQKAASNSNLVELAGTAPASAGLSVLVVYRHSSF